MTLDQAMEVLQSLQVGSKLRMTSPPGRAGMLGYVVASFTPEDDDTHVVIRYWLVGKGRWNYTIMDVYDLQVGLWKVET